MALWEDLSSADALIAFSTLTGRALPIQWAKCAAPATQAARAAATRTSCRVVLVRCRGDSELAQAQTVRGPLLAEAC